MEITMNRVTSFLFAAGAVLAAACASNGSLPAERMASTQGRIGAAEESGAKQVPSAALHLQLAKEQSEQAAKLMKEGQNDRAKWLLMRAESDAELAIALAKEDGMKTDAQNAMDQVRDLEKANQ
jgi:hypothetical protein